VVNQKVERWDGDGPESKRVREQIASFAETARRAAACLLELSRHQDLMMSTGSLVEEYARCIAEDADRIANLADHDTTG